MAYRLKITVANLVLEAVATAIPSSTSICEIYSGTIPTDADTAVGAQIVDQAGAFHSVLVLKVRPPRVGEIAPL